MTDEEWEKQRWTDVVKPDQLTDDELNDIWRAPGGEGVFAGDWYDKPHRLIYRLLGHVADLTAQLDAATTIDAGMWKWLGERDLQPDGDSFEWGDVLNALLQYELDASSAANRLLDAVEAFFAEHDSATKTLIAMGGPGTRLKDSPSVATLRRVASSMTVKADEE